MRHLTRWLVISAALLASCSSQLESSATEQPATTQSSTTQSATPAEPGSGSGVRTTLRPGEPSPPATAVPIASDIENQRFEVDGAVVWTPTNLETLPSQASIVRFTSMLIDSGQGLELCSGGVDESLPPQCAGPVVDDLDPAGWTESIDGVTWGTRSVTVSWPPVDGHLTLISDQPALALEQFDEPEAPGLPDECEQIETFVHRDTISFYANDHPDRTAGGRSVNNGSVVILGVLEEYLEDVRRELTTTDAEPCLEVVQYSTAELSSAQGLLRSADLDVPDGPVLSSGSGNAHNRLTISVAVADQQTVEMIVSHFDDPAMLLVFGHGEILE